MLSIRGALACMDELKQNGFEDNQARVLAMAIDETVVDRLNDVMSRIDARFDRVDARFDAVDARFDAVDAQFRAMEYRFAGVDAKFEAVTTRFEGVESQLKGLKDQIPSRTYEIAVTVVLISAAIGSVGMLIYDIFIKPAIS